MVNIEQVSFLDRRAVHDVFSEIATLELWYDAAAVIPDGQHAGKKRAHVFLAVCVKNDVAPIWIAQETRRVYHETVRCTRCQPLLYVARILNNNGWAGLFRKVAIIHRLNLLV